MKYILSIALSLFSLLAISQNTITEGVDWVEFNFSDGGTCRAFDCFNYQCFGDRCRVEDTKGNKYMLRPEAWINPQTGVAFANTSEMDAFLVNQYARICQTAAPVQTEVSEVNDCDDVIDCLPADIDTFISDVQINDDIISFIYNNGDVINETLPSSPFDITAFNAAPASSNNYQITLDYIDQNGNPQQYLTNIDVTDDDSDPSNEIELPTGGNSGQILSTDGAGNYTWVDLNEHPTPLTGTTAPTFDASLHPIGTEFILQNTDGAPVATFVSDGTQWVQQDRVKEKIEIPNTEFVDKTNPTIAEVRTWVDANLTDEQKLNSELYMIEDLNDLSFANSFNTLTLFRAPLAAFPDVNVTGIDINGTVYPVSASYKTGGVYDMDVAQFEADVNTAIASTGAVLAFNPIGPHTGGGLFALSTSGTGPSTINVTINFDTAGSTNTGTLTPTTSYSFTTIGANADRPDYVWDIIRDEITELHRRENRGNVWYVDNSIPDREVAFAQKGNPNRPLKSLQDVLNYANLQDGDKVWVRKGIYNNVTFTKGNVEYHFDSGAEINTTTGYVGTFDITDEDLVISGNGKLNNGAVTLRGNCTANIEVEQFSGVYGNNLVGQVYINANEVSNSDTGDRSICVALGTCDVDFHFDVRKYIGHYLIAYSQPKSGVRFHGNVDYAKIESNGRPAIWWVNQDDNCEASVHINTLEYTGSSGIGAGFINSNETIEGSSFLNNSKITIVIDRFIMLNASTSTNTGLVNSMYINSINNTEINIEIKSGISKFNIYNDNNATYQRNNFKYRVSGDFEIDNTLNTVAPSLLDANSEIIIDANIKSNNDHILNLTNASSQGKVFVRNNKLESVKEAIEFNSEEVFIYNSTIINDGTVDVVNPTAGPTNIFTHSSATNSTVSNPNVTEVGSPIIRNVNFK